MASTNIWHKFKALLPQGVRVVVTINRVNPNGTCRGTLRNGSAITVHGEGEVGQRVFVVDGEIRGVAGVLEGVEGEV